MEKANKKGQKVIRMNMLGRRSLLNKQKHIWILRFKKEGK